MGNFYKFITISSSILLFWNLSEINASSQPRTCFSCKGIKCLRTTLNQTEMCNDPLDVCVTIFKDFTIEQKGCLLNVAEEERSKCDRKSLECDICEGDLCNKYGRLDFMCLECDSEKDKNCATNPEKIEPIRCPAPKSINSYCYTEKQKNGKVKRGYSIETSHQKRCYESKDSDCTLCIPSDTDICNAPSSMKDTSGSGPNSNNDPKPNPSDKKPSKAVSSLVLNFQNILLISVMVLISLRLK